MAEKKSWRLVHDRNIAQLSPGSCTAGDGGGMCSGCALLRARPHGGAPDAAYTNDSGVTFAAYLDAPAATLIACRNMAVIGIMLTNGTVVTSAVGASTGCSDVTVFAVSCGRVVGIITAHLEQFLGAGLGGGAPPPPALSAALSAAPPSAPRDELSVEDDAADSSEALALRGVVPPRGIAFQLQAAPGPEAVHSDDDDCSVSQDGDDGDDDDEDAAAAAIRRVDEDCAAKVAAINANLAASTRAIEEDAQRRAKESYKGGQLPLLQGESEGAGGDIPVGAPKRRSPPAAAPAAAAAAPIVQPVDDDALVRWLQAEFPDVRFNITLVSSDASYRGVGSALLNIIADIIVAAGAAQAYLEALPNVVTHYEVLWLRRAVHERAQYYSTYAMVTSPQRLREGTALSVARQAARESGRFCNTAAVAPTVLGAEQRVAFIAALAAEARARIADPSRGPLHAVGASGAPTLHTTATHFVAAADAIGVGCYEAHMKMMRAHVSVKTQDALDALNRISLNYTVRPAELGALMRNLIALGSKASAAPRGKGAAAASAAHAHVPAHEPLLDEIVSAATTMLNTFERTVRMARAEDGARVVGAAAAAAAAAAPPKKSKNRKRAAAAASPDDFELPTDELEHIVRGMLGHDECKIVGAFVARWFRSGIFLRSPEGRALMALIDAEDAARKREADERAAAAKLEARRRADEQRSLRMAERAAARAVAVEAARLVKEQRAAERAAERVASATATAAAAASGDAPVRRGRGRPRGSRSSRGVLQVSATRNASVAAADCSAAAAASGRRPVRPLETHAHPKPEVAAAPALAVDDGEGEHSWPAPPPSTLVHSVTIAQKKPAAAAAAALGSLEALQQQPYYGGTLPPPPWLAQSQLQQAADARMQQRRKQQRPRGHVPPAPAIPAPLPSSRLEALFGHSAAVAASAAAASYAPYAPHAPLQPPPRRPVLPTLSTAGASGAPPSQPPPPPANLTAWLAPPPVPMLPARAPLGSMGSALALRAASSLAALERSRSEREAREALTRQVEALQARIAQGAHAPRRPLAAAAAT